MSSPDELAEDRWESAEEEAETTREPSRRARWSARVRHVLRRYRSGTQEELTRAERVLAAPFQLVLLSIRELLRDGIIERASSLSFFSVLSIVPLLSVVTALLGAFGVFDPVQSDLGQYLQVLFPSAGRDVARYLQEFSTRGASSIGGINGVVLLVISIFLFNSIERSLTAMWGGAHNRSLVAKFLMFYTMITLGPILLILSIAQTASAQLFIDAQLGIDTHAIDRILPFIYALVVFTLMNKILPNVRVEWRAALLGGALTALGFELAKFGFNQYVAFFLSDSYNRLYGALGTVAIFFLWVYVTWMVILIGSEMAYCFQHMERMLRLDTPLEETLFRGKHKVERLYDSLVVLDVLAPIALAFEKGEGAVTEDYVAFATGYEAGVVREMTEKLVSARILIVTGVTRRGVSQIIPARPLEDISLVEVFELFTEQRSKHGARTLSMLRDEHRARTIELLEGKTARDLTRGKELDEETRELLRREADRDEVLAADSETIA